MSQAFNAVPITLADGVERHLQYTYGDFRKIKALYAKNKAAPGASPEEQVRADVFNQIAGQLQDILPEVLMIGLTDKEGVTVERIADELLKAPMISYASGKFIEAFFGDRQKRQFELTLAALDAALKTMEDKVKSAGTLVPSDETTTVQ